mgnify:CR=1 FL=1
MGDFSWSVVESWKRDKSRSWVSGNPPDGVHLDPPFGL